MFKAYNFILNEKITECLGAIILTKLQKVI
jgi:hypothetical protein